MSLVKIQGNASGTGEFTIAAPNSNTNRTLTLPDATGTVQVSGNAISGTTGSFSSDLSFNSGYGSAAVAYGCRAWVNFNGTGTPAIRASGNVTSITDNGTGDYTVNFTTAMPDANYSVTTSGFESQGSYVTSGFGIRSGTAPTTSSVRGSCVSYAGSYVDPTYVLVVIFR
jgi:uncharacterized protein (AIM24 family)